MKRPAVLIVGAAAGALLVAAVGASAHTALVMTSRVGQHANVLSDEATAARTESPEPTEAPKAPPTAEPTEKPEPTEAPEPPDNETETETDNHNQTQHNDESGGDHHSGGGGGGRD